MQSETTRQGWLTRSRLLVRLFWNAEERRLRAFWRLLIVPVLWFVLLSIPSLLFAPETQGPIRSPVQWLRYFVTLALLTISLIWLAGRVLDRRYFADFGFHLDRNWWLDFGFGLVLGAILVSGIFAVELAVGHITLTDTFQTAPGSSRLSSFGVEFLTVVVLYAVVAIQEELIYRGYILTNAAEGFNGWLGLTPTRALVLAVVFSSVQFGLSHIPNPNTSIMGVFGIAIGGIVIAAAYVLTGELAISMGVHISWNVFLGAVFGFPTSGIDYGVHLFAIRSVGPSLVTGGAFGPEAGALLLGACLVGVVLLVGWVRLRYGTIKMQETVAISDLRS